ncbi:MAG: proton-conducting transporter membrane subunit, partial [Phycisphaerae bacterium]
MDLLLTIIVFLPMAGGILCLLAPKSQVKTIAVLTTAATFIISLWLFRTFYADSVEASQAIAGASYGNLHHVIQVDWISGENFKIEYFLGIDGLSFPLVILTTLVSFLACLASWNFESWKVNKGIKAYFFLFLMLQTGMLGVFVALDFFLFYIFWEVMLLPMYFLIGVWGGARKEYAAIKFFLFTLAGSVLMLVALVAIAFPMAGQIASLTGIYIILTQGYVLASLMLRLVAAQMRIAESPLPPGWVLIGSFALLALVGSLLLMLPAAVEPE